MSGSEPHALADVLASGFAVHRLCALGWASLNASALPVLVLWIGAGVHLPAALMWLGLVLWPACAALGAASLGLAWRLRRRYDTAQPAARTLARIHFAAGSPSGSALLACLAGVAGGGIWVGAAAPHAVAEGTMTGVRVAWAALATATLAVRAREAAG